MGTGGGKTRLEGCDSELKSRGTGDRLDGGRRVRFPVVLRGFWLGFCVFLGRLVGKFRCSEKRNDRVRVGCSRAARPRPKRLAGSLDPANWTGSLDGLRSQISRRSYNSLRQKRNALHIALQTVHGFEREIGRIRKSSYAAQFTIRS